MDWLWLLLGGSISGVAVAGIAKLLLPGKQVISGIEMLVIGTAAGFVGGLISGLFGLDDEEGWMRIVPLGISVGLAALAIVLWLNFRNKQIKNLVVPGEPGAGKEAIGKTKDAMANTKKETGAAIGSATPGAGKETVDKTKGAMTTTTKAMTGALDNKLDGPGKKDV